MVGLVFVLGLAALVGGGVLYSRKVAEWMGVDDSRPTPAVSKADGRDYVATPTGVVFAHHFASIAGAGPILGPVIALIFGWVPAVIWIVVGGVLIGAVHDFGALYATCRAGGRSLASVARDTLGRPAFALTILYTILMLVLVNATFLNVSARALTSIVPAEVLRLPAGQSIFREFADEEGVRQVVIGGIASTSVIVISLLAPVMGWLYLKKKLAVWKCSLIAIAITLVSVTVGVMLPVRLPPLVWKLCLSFYVLVAAGIPVWILLQPRDFINVHFLYVGLALFVVLVVGLQVSGAGFELPGLNLAEAGEKQGPIWPLLFVLIACGAISGFHSLCAGGTTCKQIARESDARRVGYFGMILESILALSVTVVVAVGLSRATYMGIMYADKPMNPALAFATGLGEAMNRGLGLPSAWGALFAMLMLEGFVVTTLDTSVRLNRYLFQELWSTAFKKPPAFLGHYWVNSALAVILMFLVALPSSIGEIWKVFGSGNQLLAAMGLLFVAVWLATKGRKWHFAAVPAALMVVTTFAALYLGLRRGVAAGKILMPASSVMVGLLGGAIVVIAAARLVRGSGPVAEAAGDGDR